jgi:hypothetical protein
MVPTKGDASWFFEIQTQALSIMMDFGKQQFCIPAHARTQALFLTPFPH